MKRIIVVATVVVLGASLLTVAPAQQQTRDTQSGRLEYGELVWDFENNTFVITGSPALLSVQGLHDAELCSPRITVDASSGLTEIHGAVASGPVRLTMLTAPDSSGVRRRINATCDDRASYDQASATVKMIGSVVADITTLPESDEEAAHLESEQITVDLRASTLTASSGNFEVTTEIEEEEEQQ